MPDLTIPISDQSECGCGETVASDLHICPSCGANIFRMPFGKFFSDLERGLIMDARYGGLILGRQTPDDDIPMYAPIGGGLFQLQGLMQGGEYILSRAASVMHRKKLEEINSEKGADDLSQIQHYCRSVIDTNSMPQHGGLWIVRGQFIVNRFATRKYIADLDRFNSEANTKIANDPSSY